MSWRQQPRTASAWRQAVGHLRQEYSSAGAVSHVNLSAGLEALRSTPADALEQELVEDLSFLVQQLVGSLPSPPSPRNASGALGGADPAAVSSLCRLLSALAASRGLKLHARAAILILGALRNWSDSAAYPYPTPASPRGSTTSLSEQHSAPPSGDGGSSSSSTSEACSGAQQDALSALVVLLPDHLPQLPQHERVAQLAALQSLVCATPRTQHAPTPTASTPSLSPSIIAAPTPPTLEAQCLALQALAACCERNTPASSTSSGSGSGPNPTGGAASPSGLTQEEAEGVLATVCALLHAVACRGRPVEDSAHSRLYAALLRALQAAMGASRQAWVPRAAGVVEGLQRLLTYGAAASAAASSAAGAAAAAAAATSGGGEGTGPAGLAAGAAAAGADGGRRYRPPHLRCRESDASGVMSDSDVGSDTEGPGGGPGPGPGAGAGSAGGVVVDRYRSSRVRLGALGVVQAMARGDAKAMQPHWTTLMPLQAPLAPRPLTPHLLTVLLHDPMTKVRALAAATISSLLEGPAPRAILAVAEARTATSRAPVRGFLTLSLSLGQLLLALHTGLLAAVSREPSALALPAVLRALVVLVGATPYERLPPELLPQIISTLRASWASLNSPSSSSASSSSSSSHPAQAISPAELAPIHAAYLACLAECFSTKQPIPGLAAHLQGPEGGAAAAHMLAELLALGRDPGQPAVLRIEALGALKGIAAHYAFVMPADAWDDIVATAAVGLSPPQPPASPRGATLQRSPSRDNTASANINTAANGSLSRSSSSSSLQQGSWRSGGAGNAHQQQQRQQHTGSTQGQGQAVGSASNTPEDKAAQLSVKLVSDFLASAARQLGLCSGEAAGPDGEGGGGLVPPASPCVVPLAAAGARQQAASVALLSPVSVTSEEEREAGVRRLGRLWQEAFGLLVPAATAHSSYMVRSAGLTCLGEVPAAAFAALPPALQHQLLQLLAAAAAADAVAAVRAAACKALGAAAALPAALDDPGLGAAVSSALQACTRDTVLSVRMAAAWAVANLCDAYRARMAAAWVVLQGAAHGAGEVEAEANRSASHAKASTSGVAWSPAGKGARKGCTTGPQGGKDGPAANGGGAAAAGERSGTGAALQPHHYQQLAALCTAAVAATQDTDKVRANGIRAVGNLLACLTPALAPNLASTSTTSTATRIRTNAAAHWGSPGPAAGRGAGPSTGKGPPPGTEPAATEHPAAATTIDLDAWLDSALGCLQSCLTTGNMKVQWNACYAVTGLLRNAQLRANPRVEARVGPLLLLLVMLVRESANFKIRTHAAAALAALPCRTAYGDVLPDALLVVAAALEGLEGGSRAGPGTAPSGAPPGAKRDAQGGGDEDGEGGDGRFPNFRYAAGLSAQLKSTLVHLLALAEAGDARRVREALVRRLDGIQGTLKEQLAEGVASLQAAVDAASEVVALPSASPGEGVGPGWAGRSSSGSVGAVGKSLELPSDPFGLEGFSGRSGGASPHGAGGAKQGLVGALRGLSLRELCEAPAEGHMAAGVGAVGGVSPTKVNSPPPRPCRGVVSNGESAEGGKHGLVVQVPSASCIGVGEDAGVRQARRRLAALRGALCGFAALLPQLGPAGEAVLADVRAALGDANISS